MIRRTAVHRYQEGESPITFVYRWGPKARTHGIESLAPVSTSGRPRTLTVKKEQQSITGS